MSTAPLATALNCLRCAAEGRSDRQLLEAYAGANDQAAFATLVRRHGPMVLGVCRRVLQDVHNAEDAFQAVFLTLARKAALLRQGEALTAWLHGVSYRVALRARRDAARRRKHEGRAAPRTNPPAWELGWRELQGILDEEVERLPPAYRDVFVLCCLDGLSRAEAAECLGVGENTVFSRLARARKRLREQLARRGISLASVLTALAVSGRGQAALPPRLVGPVVEAAVRLGAGAPVTGLSAKVLSLAEGVTRTMMPNKYKLATALILTLCALGTGLGVLARPTAAPKDPPSTQADRPRAEAAAHPAKGPKNEAVEFGGRVLDPDGQPAEGARVYLFDSSRGAGTPEVRATSTAEGHFRFALPLKDIRLSASLTAPWYHVFVMATARGFGPAVASVADPTAAG